MRALKMRPFAQCQAHRCVYEEFKTWRQAKTFALAHAKETDHTIRIEQIRTLLIEPPTKQEGQI